MPTMSHSAYAAQRRTDALTVLKVKPVEVQALHQIPQGFGFEGSHAGIAHLPANKREGGRGGSIFRTETQEGEVTWKY